MRFFCFALIALVSCGDAGQKSGACTIEETGGGAVITCPDGSSVSIDGARGQDGADGTDNRIVSSHFCSGLLASTPLVFVYQAAVLASGDVFAYGGIRGGAFETGASAYYAAGQNGASTAKVIFQSDNLGTANGGWWEMSLNRASGVTTIVYHDTEASGGSDTWTMAASACVVNQY